MNLRMASFSLLQSVFVGAAVLSGQVFAQTVVTLSPNHDGHIQSDTPTASYGTTTQLMIGNTGGTGAVTNVSYLQFNLSTLPAGTVASARLQLSGSQETGGSGIGIRAYGGTPTTPWTETALVWNTGFSLTAVTFSGTPLSTTTVQPPPVANYSWDVTAYIASRRSAGHATIGLNNATTNSLRTAFNSRQASSSRPQLIVTILPPGSVSLTPTADTYTQQGTPDVNYGTATTVLVRKDPANTLNRNGYFQFDLSTVPAGVISRATLRVFGSHDLGGTSASIRAHGGTTTTAWNETELTHENQFQMTGVDFNGTPLATTVVLPPPSATYSWDVTSYVASRRSVGHATIGLGYVVTDVYRSTFNSREATSNPPQLVVEVNGSPPPPPPPPPPAVWNWPMFGRGFDSTRASSLETAVSATNVQNLAVKIRVAGSGVASTPALVDGIAYYSDFGGNLRSVNATTGAINWSVRLQGGMLTPSPAVTSDTVYIGGDNAMVYAVNRSNGAVRWSRKIENTPSTRISGSPIVVGNTLIIGVGSLQVGSGPSPTNPFRGRVVGMDTTTGNVKWSAAVCTDGCIGVSVWSTAAVDTTLGLAYIGTGQAYTAPAGPLSDALVAINYNTGAIVWSYQFTPDDVYTWPDIGQDMDYDVGAAPNLFTVNGVAMVGVADKGGSYAVLRRSDGALQWRTLLGFGSRRGGVMGSTAYANGAIYVIENTSIQESQRNAPDSVPGTGTVFSLNAATGAINWQLLLDGGSIGAGVAYANGLVYVMTWDGRLRVINATTGLLLRSIAVGTAVGSYVGGFPNGSASGPSLYNGRIYAGYGWTWGSSVAGGLSILSINGQ